MILPKICIQFDTIFHINILSYVKKQNIYSKKILKIKPVSNYYDVIVLPKKLLKTYNNVFYNH